VLQNQPTTFAKTTQQLSFVVVIFYRTLQPLILVLQNHFWLCGVWSCSFVVYFTSCSDIWI